MNSKTFGDELMERVGEDIESSDSRHLIGMLSGQRTINMFELEQHIIYSDEGIELTVDNCNRLIGVHLFSEGLDGNHCFKRGAPFGISFNDSHDDVVKKCKRQPDKSGKETLWLGKYVPPWDLFLFPTISVHFQYSRVDERVEMITVMWGGAFGSETS